MRKLFPIASLAALLTLTACSTDRQAERAAQQRELERLAAENRQLQKDIHGTATLLGNTSLVTVVAGGCLAIALFKLWRNS